MNDEERKWKHIFLLVEEWKDFLAAWSCFFSALSFALYCCLLLADSYVLLSVEDEFATVVYWPIKQINQDYLYIIIFSKVGGQMLYGAVHFICRVCVDVWEIVKPMAAIGCAFEVSIYKLDSPWERHQMMKRNHIKFMVHWLFFPWSNCFRFNRMRWRDGQPAIGMNTHALQVIFLPLISPSLQPSVFHFCQLNFQMNTKCLSSRTKTSLNYEFCYWCNIVRPK